MFLSQERKLLEKYVPGLDDYLANAGLSKLEEYPASKLKDIIKEFDLPGLFIPEKFGGRGIDPFESIRIQRAIASRAPSLALMLTMHNFTVSFNVSLADYVPCCAQLLSDAANNNLLIGSAFAEGRFGAGILDSTVYIEEHDGGYLITGSKKPCTMASTMDIITVGIAKKLANDDKATGMAILDIHSPGVTQKPFWKIPTLSAADNNELLFDNVWVAKDQVLLSDKDDAEMSEIVSAGEVGGLCWFEIMACTSYLGAVSAMAEHVLHNSNADVSERAQMGGDIESAQCTLDGAVRLILTEPHDQALLARVLMVRYSLQKIIALTAMHASEMVGGLTFIKNNEMSTLLTACRFLAFHPMSRKAAEPMLAQWLCE